METRLSGRIKSLLGTQRLSKPPGSVGEPYALESKDRAVLVRYSSQLSWNLTRKGPLGPSSCRLSAYGGHASRRGSTFLRQWKDEQLTLCVAEGWAGEIPPWRLGFGSSVREGAPLQQRDLRCYPWPWLHCRSLSASTWAPHL